MKLLTYSTRGERAVGLLGSDDHVRDLTEVVGTSDLTDVVARWDQLVDRVAAAASAPGRPAPEVELLAPFPHPRRNIFCVGRNYREHAKEFGASGYDSDADKAAGTDHLPTHPVVFTKPASSVVGPDAYVESHPTVTKELDYEAELAVIIGVGGRDIAASDAARHVWGLFPDEGVGRPGASVRR